MLENKILYIYLKTCVEFQSRFFLWEWETDFFLENKILHIYYMYNSH